VIALNWTDIAHPEDWEFNFAALKRGYFSGTFNIVLSAERPNTETGSGDLTSADIDGLWLDLPGLTPLGAVVGLELLVGTDGCSLVS
jgi:hypothetical protein